MALTFEQVMQDPEGAKMVAAIEDTLSSLEGKEDEMLEGVLRGQIADLEEATGYTYTV